MPTNAAPVNLRIRPSICASVCSSTGKTGSIRQLSERPMLSRGQWQEAARFFASRSGTLKQTGQRSNRRHDVRRWIPELVGGFSSIPLDPERRQTRGSRAVDVPAVGRDKADFIRTGVEVRCGQFIYATAWFEDFDFIDADHGVKESRDTGTVDSGRQHVRAAV